VTLPPLLGPELDVHGDTWRVSGRETDGYKLLGWARCTGRLGEREVEVARWRLPDSNRR